MLFVEERVNFDYGKSLRKLLRVDSVISIKTYYKNLLSFVEKN